MRSSADLSRAADNGLPWIQVAPGAPYFVTEDGRPWHPVGQNDAISWDEFQGLFRRKDLPAVDRHLAWLADHGVTCLRLMMEYSQVRHRYLEKPVGRFVPAMVQLWDDLLALCGKHGLRCLLTPFDTFWMYLHWRHHPYSRGRGGPCEHPREWLTDRSMIEAAKARLSFMVTRWGGSGAIFAWDLWNEMHPAHMGDDPTHFASVAAELSGHVRSLELRLYGRARPQTVSLFGPVLHQHPAVADTIFRHPLLDFASTHFYDEGTIDWPRNTVDPAVRVGELVREALEHAPPGRPFFDSEHGPIHFFKDKKKTLPEAFDDEYFRHIQWAHIASGGAGGGMRWPNRNPHVLTSGMRKAQKSLATFLPQLDWTSFRRQNLNEEARATGPVRVFACGDDRQAVAWLLRTDTVDRDSGRLRPDSTPVAIDLEIPGLGDGAYVITPWATAAGPGGEPFRVQSRNGRLSLLSLPIATDLALALQPV